VLLTDEQQQGRAQSSFRGKLEARIASIDSLLCIGLDPHEAELFPNKDNGSNGSHIVDESARADAAFTFCKTIIDATLPYSACYKPNSAFFEALGAEVGMATLRRVLREIPAEVPVLLDVKRGDIGSTAAAYAQSAYEHFGGDGGAVVDAVTLSPLMGWDSVEPFVTGAHFCSAFLLLLLRIPSVAPLLILY